MKKSGSACTDGMTAPGEHPSLSQYFATIFPGKVRKIAVNAGLGCPNRDGTISTGGCIFCNNAAFVPRYALGHEKENSGNRPPLSDCPGKSVPGITCKSVPGITEQIDRGIEFSRGKGQVWGYLPYFQSYSNTYGDTRHLIGLYEEALSHPGVVGLVIATRPDCLSPDLLDYFERRFGQHIEQYIRWRTAGRLPDAPMQPQWRTDRPYLLVELGIESTNDDTLLRINRGHNFACCRDAVRALAERGIDVGAHIILGLPGEGPDDYVLHAERLSGLPLRTLKLHHLQVVKNTTLEQMYRQNPDIVHLFTPEEYAATVHMFLNHLRSDIVLDRFVTETPPGMVVAPAWGLKPSEFQALLRQYPTESVKQSGHLCSLPCQEADIDEL